MDFNLTGSEYVLDVSSLCIPLWVVRVSSRKKTFVGEVGVVVSCTLSSSPSIN
jgi:hypothetical protein